VAQSNKFMMNNLEVYVDADNISVNWIANNIYKVANLKLVSVDMIAGQMVYEGAITLNEIIDDSGFNYEADPPNYGALVTQLIGSKAIKHRINVDMAEIAAFTRLEPALDQINGFAVNDYIIKKQSDFDGQRADRFWVLDSTNYPISVDGDNYNVKKPGIFVQPFAHDKIITGVTASSSNDGTVTFYNTWGGPGPLEYRLTQGPTTTGWQASGFFENLPDGEYIAKMRDSNGVTSLDIPFTVADFILDFETSVTNASGLSEADGVIDVIVSEYNGAEPTFEYSKDEGTTWQTEPSFAGLLTGTYKIVVKDGNGSFSATKDVYVSY
jgi:hypothetical protein